MTSIWFCHICGNKMLPCYCSDTRIAKPEIQEEFKRLKAENVRLCCRLTIEEEIKMLKRENAALTALFEKNDML